LLIKAREGGARPISRSSRAWQRPHSADTATPARLRGHGPLSQRAVAPPRTCSRPMHCRTRAVRSQAFGWAGKALCDHVCGGWRPDSCAFRALKPKPQVAVCHEGGAPASPGAWEARSRGACHMRLGWNNQTRLPPAWETHAIQHGLLPPSPHGASGQPVRPLKSPAPCGNGHWRPRNACVLPHGFLSRGQPLAARLAAGRVPRKARTAPAVAQPGGLWKSGAGLHWL
jgi:hypothetical protein